MSKANRLIEMVITINAKRHFTVRELADEFSVSKRTILRDLQALEQAGIPLYSQVGAAGGYHILKERVLPPITFSESEAKAIFFACQSLQFYRNLPFAEETAAALKKFLNCLSPDMQNSIMQIQSKIVFWTPDRHCDSPLLNELFAAVTENKAVTVRYSSVRAESVRTIIPIGLYAMKGLWYCPAYCMKSDMVREFRVDRMKEIIKTEAHAVNKNLLPVSIHEYLDKMEVGSDYHIKIKLTDIGVKHCESEFLLARGLQIFQAGDGLIELDVLQSTLDWIADYCLPLGRHATVLEPPELVDLMKEKVRELHCHYCAP